MALLEVQALFGSPVQPGGLTLNKAGRWALVSADVHLSAVADLTSTAEQETMRTSAQELTCDWLGYHQRGPRHSVQQPIGIAPAQQLGEALYNDARLPEGIRAISSKVPYNMTLVVFPENVRGDSRIEFEFDQDSMENSVRMGQGAY